jgi:hypothetical protein
MVTSEETSKNYLISMDTCALDENQPIISDYCIDTVVEVWTRLSYKRFWGSDGGGDVSGDSMFLRNVSIYLRTQKNNIDRSN